MERAGGQAVLTDPAHHTGSDRIFEAIGRFDPARRHDAVVNLQGDLPTIPPELVRAAFGVLDDGAVDIGTLVCEIVDDRERFDPNVPKVVAAFPAGARVARAHYFSRVTVPGGAGPLYHHIGIYAYRRAALERFVALPPGILERRERLEQLRAIEAGMRIDADLVDVVPIGVDTESDLARARELLAPGAATR